MRRVSVFVIGLFVMAVGLVRIAVHTPPGETLMLPGCTGGMFVVHLAPATATQTHCWGCPVAWVGLALILIAALSESINRRRLV